MSWSWVDTEYSIHRVQYPCKIVCLPFILMITSWPLNVAWTSGMPPYTTDRHQPALQESSKVTSPCHVPTVASILTDEKCLLSRRAVHLLPISTHTHSLDFGIQTRLTTASKCISKLARLQPPSSHVHDLHVHVHTGSITISEGISKFTRLRPQSVSPNMLDYRLQVCLQTCSITASECISEFTRLSFLGAARIVLTHRLQQVQTYRV